ncbi:MAG: shikimate kinase [Proteobacteria bacterium]|nr:shikimate kinase [Pseudomonadota bacterium]MDE3208142.1 shikimate kinase [Pseudomonadota bacterium]
MMTKNCNNLFLIGLMGAGKTTVGKQLARTRNMNFLDSDHEIEHRTGASIPLIFELEGEEGFREREALIIEEITQNNNQVIATGGGTVLNDKNRKHLTERGIVIYLRASAEELWERTKHDKNRPLLLTEDPLAKLKQLESIRAPLYENLADIIIDTGKKNLYALVQQLNPLITLYIKTHSNDKTSHANTERQS